MLPIVQTGLDLIEKSWPKNLMDARVGLLVHPASVNHKFEHASDICKRSRKFRLEILFGPQHGIRGETQDNMIEWEGFTDNKTGVAVYSLYGKTRQPDQEILRNIDLVIVDMQDIGSRYYTFIWTLALMMEACCSQNKAVVVLDRPNPIGGTLIEGPVLRPNYRSFVGLHPLPVRHGMTIGEISLYLKDKFYPKLNLQVIQMAGWHRDMWFDDTGLPWVLPSPNMPTIETAAVYPGMCLLEGTNISEGRGTTRPFEICGAPFIDPEQFVAQLMKIRLPGVIFRPLYFIPTFQKHAGRLCGGLQIHISDRERYRPFKTAVGIIKVIRDLYPKEFLWNNPPYEYEETLLPIDILAGSDCLRRGIEKGDNIKTMESSWNEELRRFKNGVRKNYLLY